MSIGLQLVTDFSYKSHPLYLFYNYTANEKFDFIETYSNDIAMILYETPPQNTLNISALHTITFTHYKVLHTKHRTHSSGLLWEEQATNYYVRGEVWINNLNVYVLELTSNIWSLTVVPVPLHSTLYTCCNIYYCDFYSHANFVTSETRLTSMFMSYFRYCKLKLKKKRTPVIDLLRPHICFPPTRWSVCVCVKLKYVDSYVSKFVYVCLHIRVCVLLCNVMLT